LNRQRHNGTTNDKDDHAFIVVVGIPTPTSILANTGTAFIHREKKYEERERERREIAI
jgi:hypothetical protein